jgi:DMSO/TMAO reductase YedYZ molybdopterin-dependent catalytic subunit
MAFDLPRRGKGLPEEVASRVPPGQKLTTKFPVLHYGSVPKPDLHNWDFRVRGLVEEELRLTYDELTALPTTRIVTDLHCVTGWSQLDMAWEGVAFKEVLKLVKPLPEARFVMAHAESNFTANLPLEDLLADSVLLAWKYDDKPLTPEHGYPLRLLVPHLYLWKSAKWLRGFEFMAENRPGFWERYGYHIHGDPWKEERFGQG